MRASLRDRVAFFLERMTFLHPVLLAYDGEHDGKKRYFNRINGHVVMKVRRR